MRPSHFSLLPIALFLLVPLVAGRLPLSNEAALCSRTDHLTLCLYAARTYGSNYSTVDAGTLLSMHIDMATEHTKTAKNLATSFLARTTDPRVKSAFEICASQFGDAIDELGTAKDAIAKRDAGTANAFMSAAITYYSTCDDAFTEIPAKNPLRRNDAFLMKMVSNALALGDVVLG